MEPDNIGRHWTVLDLSAILDTDIDRETVLVIDGEEEKERWSKLEEREAVWVRPSVLL